MALECSYNLADSLRAGGIYYNLKGRSKETILRNAVDGMIFLEPAERDLLYRTLLAREALESTAVGEGIAIPHPRNPGALRVAEPIVSLCFLEEPVDFGALDGRPVFAIFVLISPTPKTHLHILSRLFFSLHQPDFKKSIVNRMPADLIIAEAGRVAQAIAKTAVT